MSPIVLEPEIYQQVERVASEQQTSIEQVVNQAARQYLWELKRRKISQESKIYQARHRELKEKYLGQYIAMRDGQVVDNDFEFEALLKRIREQYGDAPVLMTRVEDEALPTLTRRGFVLERT